ncbi:membrane-associated phospholipid phosphatase [Metallosphaera yellowstonensis MK1]|jgi:undecaprenyl-diphosphatase|uniref:Membrane-associated phospholipid phosphatase n=1 Tax=Metallosphaera yellowstonensis MK1 TaxID=671065 RepID=H2C5E5_9CREN|nr:phosphatase PAP2 family protein [Metallosphaera yellowstonensis]EHP69022.1 membrane-associated phospholipid phosphatase [Metallosphaera yellowstonensis MK1]
MRYYWAFLLGFLGVGVAVKVLTELNFPGNVQLFQLVNYHQVNALNPVMVFLSKYGREYVWIPLTALLLIFRKTRRIAVTLAASFILAILVGEISKYAFAQERPFLYVHPDFLLVPPPHDYSFPSGHALIVSDGALVLMKQAPTWLWVVMLMEAILVSYSRVYVGVHWPIDVIAGWLLGAWTSLLTVDLERRGILSSVEKFLKA